MLSEFYDAISVKCRTLSLPRQTGNCMENPEDLLHHGSSAVFLQVDVITVCSPQSL